MKMNSIEFWAMNNPVRGWVQKHYEAPRLKQLSSGAAEDVLEIGCGQGTGAGILYRLFEPRSYVGIDLDPRMIERARRRCRHLENARFIEGDASALSFDEASFDLIVDFGIVHHIPNWRDALAEVHRTLRPGGEFLFEDLPVETWERGIGRPLKGLLDHPYDSMFRQREFLDALEALGFRTEAHEANPLSFHYFWGRAVKRS